MLKESVKTPNHVQNINLYYDLCMTIPILTARIALSAAHSKRKLPFFIAS
jgi:hypothetical protein